MLPVAVLPVCSILMGIGYWIDPTGWGANSAIAAFLIKAGGSIIDNMGILFAIGVGVGMSEDNDGTGGLAALVSWLMITTLLSPAVVGMLKGIPVEEVAPAFGKIATQFTGILAGLIGSTATTNLKEQSFLQRLLSSVERDLLLSLQQECQSWQHLSCSSHGQQSSAH